MPPTGCEKDRKWSPAVGLKGKGNKSLISTMISSYGVPFWNCLFWGKLSNINIKFLLTDLGYSQCCLKRKSSNINFTVLYYGNILTSSQFKRTVVCMSAYSSVLPHSRYHHFATKLMHLINGRKCKHPARIKVPSKCIHPFAGIIFNNTRTILQISYKLYIINIYNLVSLDRCIHLKNIITSK